MLGAAYVTAANRDNGQFSTTWPAPKSGSSKSLQRNEPALPMPSEPPQIIDNPPQTDELGVSCTAGGCRPQNRQIIAIPTSI